MTLDELQRFHRLYERTAADLARIATFSAEPETRRYLETLVARAYGEMHETREKRRRIQPLVWFFRTFPQTFRRHARQFYLSLVAGRKRVFSETSTDVEGGFRCWAVVFLFCH